ncbi:trypsin-like serine peptidase [Nonomuraea sp. NPDC049400]|uniref:trypsin-like serine peptidase n=1 Tax=Nonomuraea sp. NPDC049400 TaxID=3364352 RepID=UPI0037AE2A5F
MKRILLPAGGAILATGLLAAGLASTAQADSTVSADVLAAQDKAADVLSFWTASNNAAMDKAVAFNPDALEVSKISSGGGYTSDTKPGSTAPIGEEKKVAAKVQNVNLPKTIGKVFFEGRDGKLYWCSGTSIQSQYRNLVATAAHCVYDIGGNDEVVSRWVFVPGYYQKKAPFGVYVGKQAFTHYDFDIYEDFDRDYAFVTVYDGIGGVLNNATKVTFDEYNAASAKGQKTDKKLTEVSDKEYFSAIKDPTKLPYYDIKPGTAKKVTGPDFPGAVVDKREVDQKFYEAQEKAGKVGKGTDFIYGEPVVEQVDEATFKAYSGPGTKAGPDKFGNYTITHYYVQDWYVPGQDTKYYRVDYYVFSHHVKSVGRLGDNVGGQGFAWNQPAGKAIRAFGYPYGPHLDGNKPFTGVTPKWCYGPTAKKALLIPSKKVEEQLSMKCTVTAGFDGGPWLYKYSNAKRLGYVNGVTSLIADVDGNKRYDTITSAYFDGETNVVYQAAAKSWSGKLIP